MISVNTDLPRLHVDFSTNDTSKNSTEFTNMDIDALFVPEAISIHHMQCFTFCLYLRI